MLKDCSSILPLIKMKIKFYNTGTDNEPKSVTHSHAISQNNEAEHHLVLNQDLPCFVCANLH